MDWPQQLIPRPFTSSCGLPPSTASLWAPLSPWVQPVPLTTVSWALGSNSLSLCPPHGLTSMTKGLGPSALFILIMTIVKTVCFERTNLLRLLNTHQIAKQCLDFFFFAIIICINPSYFQGRLLFPSPANSLSKHIGQFLYAKHRGGVMHKTPCCSYQETLPRRKSHTDVTAPHLLPFQPASNDDDTGTLTKILNSG